MVKKYKIFYKNDITNLHGGSKPTISTSDKQFQISLDHAIYESFEKEIYEIKKNDQLFNGEVTNLKFVDSDRKTQYEYSGSVINGKFDGKGKLTFFDYEISGEFKNGLLNGEGTQIFLNTRYDGNFKDDLREGDGKLRYSNGDIYVGKFKRNNRDGKGKYYGLNKQYIVEGEWVDNTITFGYYKEIIDKKPRIKFNNNDEIIVPSYLLDLDKLDINNEYINYHQGYILEDFCCDDTDNFYYNHYPRELIDEEFKPVVFPKKKSSTSSTISSVESIKNENEKEKLSSSISSVKSTKNEMLIEEIKKDTIELKKIIKNFDVFFNSIINNEEIDVNLTEELKKLTGSLKNLLKNKFLLYFINNNNKLNLTKNNLKYLNQYSDVRAITGLFWELKFSNNKKNYFNEILIEFDKFKKEFGEDKFIKIFGTDEDNYIEKNKNKKKRDGNKYKKERNEKEDEKEELVKYGIYIGNNRLLLLNNEDEREKENKIRIYKENEIRIYKKNLFTLDSFDTPRKITFTLPAGFGFDKSGPVGFGIDIDDKIGLIIDIEGYVITVEFIKNYKSKFKKFWIYYDYKNWGDIYKLEDNDGIDYYNIEILNRPSLVPVPVNEEYFKYDWGSRNILGYSKEYLVSVNQNISEINMKEELIGYKIILPNNIFDQKTLGIVINYQGQNIYQVRLPNNEVITVLLENNYEVIKKDYYNIEPKKYGIQLLGYKIKFEEKSDDSYLNPKMQEGIVIDFKLGDIFKVQQKNKVRWVKIEFEKIYEWEDINNFWSTTKDSILKEEKLRENLIGSIIEFDQEKRLVLAYDNSTNRYKIGSKSDSNWHSLESKDYKVLDINIDEDTNDDDINRIKQNMNTNFQNYRPNSILPLPIYKDQLEITFQKSESSGENIDLIGHILIGHKIKLPNETLGIVIYYNPKKKIYKIRLPDKKEITSPLESFELLFDYNDYSFSNCMIPGFNLERIGIRLLGYKIKFSEKKNNSTIKNGIIMDHKIQNGNHIYLIKSLDNNKSLGLFKWYNENIINYEVIEDLGQFWSSTKETIIQELLQEFRKKEKKKKQLEEKEKENNKLYYYINDKIKNYKIDRLNLIELENLHEKLNEIINFVSKNGVDFNNLEKISTDLLLGGTLNTSNKELLGNLNNFKEKVLNLIDEKKKKLEDLFNKIQKKPSDEIDEDTNIQELHNQSEDVKINNPKENKNKISSSLKSNNIRIQLQKNKNDKKNKDINDQIESINFLRNNYPDLENMNLQNLKNLLNKLKHIIEYLKSNNVIFEEILIKLSILTDNDLNINHMNNVILKKKNQSKLFDDVKDKLQISIDKYISEVEIIIKQKEQIEIGIKKQIEDERIEQIEILKKIIEQNKNIKKK